MNNFPEKTPRFTYSAYGLNIGSEIDLDQNVSTPTSIDVSIRLQKLRKSDIETEFRNSVSFERPDCSLKIQPNKTCYAWHDFGVAIVRDGKEILVDPLPGVAASDFAAFLTGALLGHLLHQRGFMVLHGSSLVVDGKGVAFLGEKGAGKSTLAVHLHNRGHQVLSDDLVPLRFSGKDIFTYSGFPRIKLRSDSVESLGLRADELPMVSNFVDKRAYYCNNDNLQSETALESIYVLNIDDEIDIKTLPTMEAFIELARHTYLNRYLRATKSETENFNHCEIVTRSIPVLRLNRPHDFKLFPKVSKLIETDISAGKRHS